MAKLKTVIEHVSDVSEFENEIIKSLVSSVPGSSEEFDVKYEYLVILDGDVDYPDDEELKAITQQHIDASNLANIDTSMKPTHEFGTGDGVHDVIIRVWIYQGDELDVAGKYPVEVFHLVNIHTTTVPYDA